MKPVRSRQFVAFLVTCILGSVGLLAPEPAEAEQKLFRVQRRFFGAPFPEVNTAHVNGEVTNSLEPYKKFSYYRTSMGMTTFTGTPMTAEFPAVAEVQAGNPVGGAFTLPSYFIDTQTTSTYFPSTAFTGYLTQSILDYKNLEGRFRPNNPYGATMDTQVNFDHNYYTMTTPNGSMYNTTTHNGLFEFGRLGNHNIEVGANKFGGTMRFLNAEFPDSLFYQYISVDLPLRFKAYGSFNCTRMGNDCSTKSYESDLGEAISSGMVSRFLLNNDTVFTTPNGTSMFGRTEYRKIKVPHVISKQYYLDILGPWTTGKVHVTKTTPGVSSMYGAHPQGTGYDTTFNGATIDTTLERTYTAIVYKGKGNYSYPTVKYKTTLKGVTRVVSMVKPRLLHVYSIPRLPSDPIETTYQANRVQLMKVYFLPEPGMILMLGSGIAGLAGLAFLRRR